MPYSSIAWNQLVKDKNSSLIYSTESDKEYELNNIDTLGQCYKILTEAKLARVFSTSKPFQSGVIFRWETRACLSGAPLSGAPL